MEATGMMFHYLSESDRRVAVEAAYQAVRRLFESLGSVRARAEASELGTSSRRFRATFDGGSSDALTQRILEDIEKIEHRSLDELDSERVGYYTNLLTTRTKERFPQSRGDSSRANDVLSEIRSAKSAF